MKIYKVSSKEVIAYHGSHKIFDKFDKDFAAQGVFWFSTDLNKILGGTSGANSSKVIYKVKLSVDNVAGWEEYDKYFLSQINDMGYDSIKLDDDWVIFDPNQIEILEKHEDL
ncbi:MAG: hypothetical protein WC119_01900 [Synergistaceae bacterium]